MFIKEYGHSDGKAVMLLHGGGLSWWSYERAAMLLAEGGFHVLLPVLDGHAGSGCEFTSMEKTAERLIAYIDKRFGGHISVIGGLSLGAQVAVEMMVQKKDICDHAIIESALVIPMKAANTLIPLSVGLSFPLVKKEWFARLQFHCLRLPPELFEDYYRDTCLIKKADMVSFLRANTSYQIKESLKDSEAKVLIMVGGRETPKMIRSSEMLHAVLKGSSLVIFDGWNHGEASIGHPERFAETVKDFVGK